MSLECSREVGKIKGSCHSTCEVVWGRDPPKVLSRKKVWSDLFLRKSHLWQSIYSDLSF